MEDFFLYIIPEEAMNDIVEIDPRLPEVFIVTLTPEVG